MKSTFHSVILALALSVSAAPVEKPTTSGKDIHQTSPHASGNKPPSDEYGPPTFFGDESSPYKGPARDDDIRESSPSAKPNGTIYPIPGNSTTTSTPAITTSTSQRLDKRFRAASRLVTPNVNNYVAKSGTLMFGMQNPVCSDVTLIFARGTTEVGNMGTCVGPELAKALRDEIPSLSVQGVDYPANSEGNTRYGASGGPYMVRHFLPQAGHNKSNLTNTEPPRPCSPAKLTGNAPTPRSSSPATRKARAASTARWRRASTRSTAAKSPRSSLSATRSTARTASSTSTARRCCRSAAIRTAGARTARSTSGCTAGTFRMASRRRRSLGGSRRRCSRTRITGTGCLVARSSVPLVDFHDFLSKTFYN